MLTVRSCIPGLTGDLLVGRLLCIHVHVSLIIVFPRNFNVVTIVSNIVVYDLVFNF